MTYFPVVSPFEIFFDLDGNPLEDGYIYIGEANQNPITNQITVYWDSTGLYPAAQPIRTIDGYPDRNGSPAKIYVNAGAFEDYSILINDKHGRLVFYAQSARFDDIASGNTVDIINDLRSISGYSQPIYIRGHSAIGDGGQGSFEWVDGAAPGTYVDDNGIIIIPLGGDGSGAWLRQYDGAVNIRWFGAYNDEINATLTTAAIQSAITGYGNITSDDGTYLINNEITIPSDRIIDLNGAVFKAATGYITSGTGNSMLVLASGASNIIIKNGTLSGNYQAADLVIFPNIAVTPNPFTSPINLIVMQSNDHVTIDNMRFVQHIYTSIKEYGIIGVNEGTFAKFTNNYFDDILGNCIDGEFAQIEVSNNTVNLIGDIRGDVSAGTKGGLIVASCKYGIVANNNIRQTTDSSIYINGSDNGKISINGNFIKYSGKDAIKALNSACDCSLTGNIVIASGKSPIGVYDDGITDKGHSTITGNVIGFVDAPTDILDPLLAYAPKTITGCSNQSSIWSVTGPYASAAIGANAAGLVIDGNVVQNVLGIGINPTEDNIIISNNLLRNVTGTAIKQQGSEFTITGNMLENVGSDGNFSTSITEIYGIFLGPLNQGNISNNTIHVSGSDAISSGPDVSRVNIIGNQIYDWNGTAGIYLNSAATPGTVKKIVINDNVMEGTDSAIRAIYLRNVDDMTICGNVINLAADGIRINSSGDMIVSNNRITNTTTDGIYIDGTTVSAALIGNTVDTSVRGVTTHVSTVNVTAFGNIGTNCSTSTVSISGVNVRPTTITVADANI